MNGTDHNNNRVRGNHRKIVSFIVLVLDLDIFLVTWIAHETVAYRTMSTTSLCRTTHCLVLASSARRTTATTTRTFRSYPNLSRNNYKTVPSRILQRRWESSSSNKNNKSNLPPLPSPAKAKKKYLESANSNTNAPHEDITAKMALLHKELEVVRTTQTKRLDLALNKPWYRKLLDPLKRYKHSVINMAAVTLAYMLAHHLFLSKKREKQTQEELDLANTEAKELQALLGTLVNPQQVEQMATKIVEEMEEQHKDGRTTPTTTGTRKGWFSRSGGSSSSSWSSRRSGGFLFSSSVVGTEERLAQVLQQELEARIGDSHLAPPERKQKSVQQLLQDNKTQLQSKEQDEEEDAMTRMLMQALEEAEQEETTADGQNVVKKRIFSM